MILTNGKANFIVCLLVWNGLIKSTPRVKPNKTEKADEEPVYYMVCLLNYWLYNIMFEHTLLVYLHFERAGPMSILKNFYVLNLWPLYRVTILLLLHIIIICVSITKQLKFKLIIPCSFTCIHTVQHPSCKYLERDFSWTCV